jgi:hypothetical protein
MRQVVTGRTTGVWGPAAKKTPGVPESPDTYRERLIKYVPVETVALYIAVYGSVAAVAFHADFFQLFARWVLILGLVGTWCYLQIVESVHDWVQLLISTAGFFVWVFALGVVPFADFPWYNQVIAALLLPVYIALAPLVDGTHSGA